MAATSPPLVHGVDFSGGREGCGLILLGNLPPPPSPPPSSPPPPSPPLLPARMASGDEKRCTVGASPSDALERVRRVEVPASSLSKVAQAWKKQYARNVHAGL
jgi:hypothetical protein